MDRFSRRTMFLLPYRIKQSVYGECGRSFFFVEIISNKGYSINVMASPAVIFLIVLWFKSRRFYPGIEKKKPQHPESHFTLIISGPAVRGLPIYVSYAIIIHHENNDSHFPNSYIIFTYIFFIYIRTHRNLHLPRNRYICSAYRCAMQISARKIYRICEVGWTTEWLAARMQSEKGG